MSLSDLSELRRALNFPSRAGNLKIPDGQKNPKPKNSLHDAGMLILFESFLGILLLDPRFFSHHIVALVRASIQV